MSEVFSKIYIRGVLYSIVLHIRSKWKELIYKIHHIM